MLEGHGVRGERETCQADGELLFRNQLRGIGNIYTDSSLPQSGAPPKVKRIVSVKFFWGNRIMLKDVSRGPFQQERDIFLFIIQ